MRRVSIAQRTHNFYDECPTTYLSRQIQHLRIVIEVRKQYARRRIDHVAFDGLAQIDVLPDGDLSIGMFTESGREDSTFGQVHNFTGSWTFVTLVFLHKINVGTILYYCLLLSSVFLSLSTNRNDYACTRIDNT
jgi:hypothetical protein